MASTDVEYSSNPNQKGKVASCLEFIYNPTTGEFMGRGGASWAKITLFYIIYYLCLAGFWAASLHILFQFMNPVSPNLTGYDSILKQNPAKIGLFYLVFYTCLAAMWSGFLALFFLTCDETGPKLRELQNILKHNPVKITGFYVVYYICLSAFWAGMWFIFKHQLDDNMPQQTGLNSLIKSNPGMGFRPMPDIVSTLIRFQQGKPDSYKIYTDHIQAYLDQYENEKQGGENYIDCQTGKDDNEREKVCRFNIDDLGNECTRKKDFGYDEGKPCVLLKLNKVFGWEPESFSNDTKPAIMGDRWDNYHIGISCEGENYADKENIGNITYYPNKGFPYTFYPYLNQEGYRAPLVMVQFEEPVNGMLIQVWCKAWAKNIYHHKNDRAGSVHFELLVD